MNEYQKSFLVELLLLLEKYHVDSVYVEDGITMFDSCVDSLGFHHYKDGVFDSITTKQGTFDADAEREMRDMK